MTVTALSVNLNKIALIRNSRPGNFPDLLKHGQACLDAGADGLTLHPRPDQRHIRPGDVHALAELVAGQPGSELNVEGNPFAGANGSYPGFMALVLAVRPHQCTLVPDSTEQLTSDHGFDLAANGPQLAPVINRLQDAGIRVSLFMDPEPEQIQRAKDIGADRIELYTGPYAAAFAAGGTELETWFQRYFRAADCARDLGLGLNAGHDLNLDNLPRFCRVPALLEVSIGHALTVDALDMGLAAAVRAYKAICSTPEN